MTARDGGAVGRVLAAALELTRTYEVPFYDAAYHALAITRKEVCSIL